MSSRSALLCALVVAVIHPVAAREQSASQVKFAHSFGTTRFTDYKKFTVEATVRSPAP